MGLFNFFATPRAFGNPRQYIDPKTTNPIVYNKKKLINLINENNGKNDCFVSHQRFLNFLDRKPFEIEISKLFFDFDGKQDPPLDAFNDICTVMKFFDKHNIPYLAVYSGMKGFHLYVPLNPTNHINATYLKKMYRSIMIHLKTELKLTTIDPSVATPTKLCRVFYTKHPKSKRYCCPLPKNIIDGGFDVIFKYSIHTPKLWYTDILKDKKYLTIEQYINYFNIDLEDEKQGIVFATTNEKYNNADNSYLRELLIYPCLINSILDIDNAIHFMRFAVTVYFKRLGFSPKWVFDFFKSRQYLDVANTDECRYQINSIYGTNYTFPSCKRIQQEGFCVGKTCPYFKEKLL